MGIGSKAKFYDSGHVALDLKFKFALGKLKSEAMRPRKTETSFQTLRSETLNCCDFSKIEEL